MEYRTFTMAIPEDTYAKLQQYKEKSGITLRRIIKEALEDKLKKVAKEKK